MALAARIYVQVSIKATNSEIVGITLFNNFEVQSLMLDIFLLPYTASPAFSPASTLGSLPDAFILRAYSTHASINGAIITL